MQCLYPVQLDERLTVPCGKCMACRISHSREWATRIVHEASCHEDNIFLTLTYSTENLPSDGSLRKDEFTKFIKLLRYHIGDKKIKYYACGEYGEDNKRPHYHAIIFGLSKSDRPTINKCWGKGFIYIGTVTYDSARYTADYVMKKKWDLWERKKIEPPFQLCSQGIGLEWLMKNEKQFRENLSVNVRGVETGLPRYYQKKLDIPVEEKLEKSIERREEKIDKFNKKWNKRKGRTFTMDDYKELRKQRELNIKGKRNLYERGKL